MFTRSESCPGLPHFFSGRPGEAGKEHDDLSHGQQQQMRRGRAVRPASSSIQTATAYGQGPLHLVMRPSGSAVGSSVGKAFMYSAKTIQSISCVAPVPPLNIV